eukprot:tig00001187_g7465.t1
MAARTSPRAVSPSSLPPVNSGRQERAGAMPESILQKTAPKPSSAGSASRGHIPKGPAKLQPLQRPPSGGAAADGMGLDSSMVPQTPPPDASMNAVATDKMSLCLEILLAGNVQSFIDFFYLTHKAEGSDAPPQDAEEPSSKPVVKEKPLAADSSKLLFIKDHLMRAENAQRQGDLQQVYESYETLARFFEQEDDQKRAVKFYEQCLDVAKLTADPHLEGQANRNLGARHEMLGDIASAIRFYERCLVLAEQAQDMADKQSATERLVAAYKEFAERCERQSDYEQAVVFHERCLSIATADRDVGTATHRVGLAYQKLGDQAKAIDYLRKYLELCRLSNDPVGEGTACQALAAAYQSRGDTGTAIQYLEQFQELAQATGVSDAQAQACGALGMIYMKRGDFPLAVHHFEKQFELARSLGQRAMVDSARVNLGIARGHLNLSPFFQAVASDLPSLLKWKNKRIPLPDHSNVPK